METKIQFLKPEAKPRYISFKIKLQQSPYVNKETCFGSHSLSFISDKILFPAFLNDL